MRFKILCGSENELELLDGDGVVLINKWLFPMKSLKGYMDFMKSRVLEIKVKQNGTDIANQIFCELIKLFHTVRRLIYGKEEMMWMN